MKKKIPVQEPPVTSYRLPNNQVKEYLPLDISSYFNNNGVSFDSDVTTGDFNGEGDTYPGEDLPPSDTKVFCEDVPFVFPKIEKGTENNLALTNHVIHFPHGRYDKLYLLGAAENGDYEENFELVYQESIIETVKIGLTSWHGFEGTKFGESIGIKCTGYHSAALLQNAHTDIYINRDTFIWVQNVDLNQEYVLRSMKCPYNPCIHFFAMTLSKSKTPSHEGNRFCSNHAG